MPNNRPIKCVIVDDEPLARAALRSLLSKREDVELVGEAENGVKAMEEVAAKRPDLLFLDIRMPVMDGLAVARKLRDPRPQIIFVTAYDKHAVEAFELHATDYLLKPFAQHRFNSAVSHARRVITEPSENSSSWEKLAAALARLEHSSSPSPPRQRLWVRSEGKFLLFAYEDIQWIRADRNAVLLHTGGGVVRTGSNIGDLEKKLSDKGFLRIHRSLIVNLSHVKEVRPWYTGEYAVIMRDGKELTLSRGYKNNLSLLLHDGGGQT